MKREFNKFEIASIKRVASAVDRFVQKKKKIEEQISILKEEYSKIVAEQEIWEAPIKNMTGGFSTEDLISKVIGENKIPKFILKYPDTVLPTELFIAPESTTSIENIDDKATVDMVDVNEENQVIPENPFSKGFND
jgi:hypothetical protein